MTTQKRDEAIEELWNARRIGLDNASVLTLAERVVEECYGVKIKESVDRNMTAWAKGYGEMLDKIYSR